MTLNIIISGGLRLKALTHTVFKNSREINSSI